MKTDFPLTKDEARAFLRRGVLPTDLDQRVHNFLEFDDCTNCDGVKDMNIVMRSWFNDTENLCPFCTGEEPFDWELSP